MLFIYESNAMVKTHVFASDVKLGLIFIRNPTKTGMSITITTQTPDQSEPFSRVLLTGADSSTSGEELLFSCLKDTGLPAGSNIIIETGNPCEYMILYYKQNDIATEAQMQSVISQLQSLNTTAQNIQGGQSVLASENTLTQVLSILSSRLIKCNTDDITLTGQFELDPNLIENNTLKVTLKSDDVPRVDPVAVTNIYSELRDLRTEVSKDSTLSTNHTGLLAKIDTVLIALGSIEDAIQSQTLSVNVDFPNTLDVSQTNIYREVDWIANPALDVDKLRVSITQTDYSKEATQLDIKSIIETIQADIANINSAMATETTLDSINNKIITVDTDTVQVGNYDLFWSFETAAHLPVRAAVDSLNRVILSPDTIISVNGTLQPNTNTVETNQTFVINPGDDVSLAITDPKFNVYQAAATTGGKKCKVEILHRIGAAETNAYTVSYDPADPYNGTPDDFQFVPVRPQVYRNFFKLRVTNTGTAAISVTISIEYEVI